jgi:hypothetical protein
MAGRRNNTLTSELADYIQHVTYDDIPARVVQRAKEAVIDGIGVMLAGHSTDRGILIRRYIGGLGVSGNCTVVGTPPRCPLNTLPWLTASTVTLMTTTIPRFPRCRTGFTAC